MDSLPGLQVQSKVEGFLICTGHRRTFGTAEQFQTKLLQQSRSLGLTPFLLSTPSHPEATLHVVHLGCRETAEQGRCGEHYYRGAGEVILRQGYRETILQSQVPSEAPQEPQAEQEQGEQEQGPQEQAETCAEAQDLAAQVEARLLLQEQAGEGGEILTPETCTCGVCSYCRHLEEGEQEQEQEQEQVESFGQRMARLRRERAAAQQQQ